MLTKSSFPSKRTYLVDDLHLKIVSGLIEDMFSWVVESDMVKTPLDNLVGHWV